MLSGKSSALVLTCSLSVLVISTASCSSGTEECPEPAVLAAGGESNSMALSCEEAITYQGRDYYPGCLAVHPSRLGRTFLRDGGETNYTGARLIKGLDRRRGFVLLQGRCGHDRRLVAGVRGLTEREFDLIRSPLR
jgi:hypothetical protein